VPRASIVALISLALHGCNASDMDEGLGRLAEKNIQAAIDVLGPPSSKRDLTGEFLYEWNRSKI
jgi:hypothetical protein